MIGIPGTMSAQASIGYNFQSNDFNTSVGGTVAFNTVYVNYSTQSGFSTGWSLGLSPQMGFPISTNFTSLGVNYSISNNSWSGNISAWGVDKTGWTFNPSVSVMIYPEHTTNLVRGQGFRSNNQVFNRMMQGDYTCQEILDYFGFKGTYDPTIEDPGQFNGKDGSIKYNEVAFSKNYDYLLAIYREEIFHESDYDIYKSKAPDDVLNLNKFEEWRAKIHMYKNQGLYLNSEEKWVDSIISDGTQAGVYYYSTGVKNNYFQSQWWHIIYKIPRLW